MLRLILFFALLMLFISYFLEFFYGFYPCVICEVQRLSLYPIIILTLLDIIKPHYNITAFLTRFFRFIITVFAVYLGIHRLKLIARPELVSGTTCLPKLSILIKYQGLVAAWKQMMIGSASCTEVNWSMWGLNLPEITLIVFSCLLIIVVTEIILYIKRCLD